MREARAHLTRIAFLCCTALLLCGCTGLQSALNPAGRQAGNVSQLWWVVFGVLAAIYLLVLFFLAGACFAKSGRADPGPVLNPEPRRERRMRVVVGSAVGITTLVLFGLLVGDFATGRSIQAMPDPDPVRVRVTGHQWWWQVRYENLTPSKMVTTANEIHVPVGKAVQLQLLASDVIHSFWAPNFNGKKDAIPGHPSTMLITAEKPGTYYGQCAEFCGAQHAHMRFVVVAEPQDKFDQWLKAQNEPAAEPSTDEQKKGKQVFLSSTCIMCHTIAGTQAHGTVGPDLTHLASRPRIAAGTLPNTEGHLGGWIIDPQSIKPGVQMPQNNLAPDDLKSLLAYLESLK